MDEIRYFIPILALTIPIIAIVGAVIVKPWIKMKTKQMELDAKLVAEKAAQYAADKGRLEERVAVLERIVTDQGYSLASEIEALRSLPTPSSPVHEKEVLK